MKIVKLTEDARKEAANIEIPMIIRIHSKEKSEHNTTSVKPGMILQYGSHHGVGFEAIIAHMIYSDLEESKNSIERISALKESFVAKLAKNKANILAIMDCLPKDSVSYQTINHVFIANSDAKQGSTSDFAAFAKTCSTKPAKNSRTKIIAEFFQLFQNANRISAEANLASKLKEATK